VSGSAPWRQRADDALWVVYGGIAQRSDSPGTSGVLGPGPHIPHTVDAFESIGLLDRGDAETWRARLQEERAAIDGDGLRERLHGLLAGLVRAAIAAPDMQAEAWQRLTVVANDLRTLGVLDSDEVHWWMSLPSSSSEAEPLGPIRRATLDRLVRSIPGPPERRRGLRLLTVDLFEDGVCVRLHLARRGRDPDDELRPLPDEIEGAEPLAPRAVQVRLEDDLGTEYLVLGGGGAGGGSGHVDGPVVYEHTLTFTPGVPDGAARLTVRTQESSFEVAL